MIVDAHLHIFLPAEEDPGRPVDDIAPADRSAPLSLLEKTMGQYGVDAAVLVPLGTEDDYVSHAITSDPGRYAGIAVWDGDVDGGRVDERLTDGGFSGLRMFHLGEDPPWPVLRRLEDGGRVLWLYPGPDDLEGADEVCRRHPDLVVVLNHTGFARHSMSADSHGRPRIDSPLPQPTESQTLALAAHPNVNVMVSGAYGFSHQPWPYPDVGEITARIADAYGTNRLLWASDFPWILDEPGYGKVLELVDIHLPGLSTTERAAVLGDNARRLVWKDV